MPLTSQIKELGAILQKLIKFEPGRIEVIHDDKHLVGVDGDADEPRSGDVGRGLGATTKRKQKCSFTRTRTE